MLQHWIASLALAMTILCCVPASATPVVADLSNYAVAMDANFIGTRLFLFGARADAGDVVVVVRGPSRNFLVRKKEKIAGLWVNRDRAKFFGVPDFYALASSRPLADIGSAALWRSLGIGETALLSSIGMPQDAGEQAEFTRAFLQYQYKRRLYREAPAVLDFMGETLFKTAVDFPDTIPPGRYTAEIYLISAGEVAGMQSIPIRVVKSGVDAFVYNYAHNFPALYGISAIVIALCAGWFAGRLFEKT